MQQQTRRQAHHCQSDGDAAGPAAPRQSLGQRKLFAQTPSRPDDKAASERDATRDGAARKPWKLLIVDDESEVHSVTKLALSDFEYQGRGLEFISAFSGQDARQIIEHDPEIAVILLDVVMETEDAGLKVVQYIRQHLGNRFVRIILRTGHPGLAPERRIIEAYDINDYRSKTDLTRDRMFSLLHTSLAAYQHLTDLARRRRELSAMAAEYKALLERVSNRLRGPAERLDGASQRLREALQDQTPETLEADWNHLDDGASRIVQLAQALGQLSRLTQQDAPKTEFSGEDALQEARQRCEPLIQRSGARIEHDSLPVLYGFRDPFVLLLEQLLLNALIFHGREPPEIEIRCHAEGAFWCLSVADRGRGIPADRLEDVFLPFVGSPSEQASDNEGLGLVLCRKVAAMHGGKIWAESRSGGGTRLLLKIPAQGGNS